MPIYEYRCEQCGFVTDVLVRSIAKPPVATCGKCGSAAVTRLFSPTVVASGLSAGDKPCADRCAQEKGGAMPPCMSGGCCGG